MLQKNKIINFYFATHKTCNMNCKYCYVPQYNRYSNRYEDSVILKSLDLLIEKFENEDFKIGSFCLHGTEASLLKIESIAQVIQKVNKHWEKNNTSNYNVAIQTNGKNFTKSNLIKLKSMIGNPKKFRIGFSIDPPKFVHDLFRDNSFDIVEKNYFDAMDLGFPVSLLSVVTKETINRLKDFGEWMHKQLDLKKKFGNPYKVKIKFATGEFGLSEDDIKVFSNFIIENNLLSLPQIFSPGYCIHDGNHCMWYEFDIDGNCYSCNKTYNNEGIFANWISEKFEQIIDKRQNLFANVIRHSDCLECQYEFLCNSGCPVDRYKTGEMAGKAHECTMVKIVYDYITNSNMHIIDFYNNNV